MPVNIDYLANHTHFIPTLAAWHHEQWQHLNPDDYDIAARCREYEIAAQTASIPLMLVAYEQNQPMGSTRLIMDDMETRPELFPWLASLFVHPHFRNQGIARQLIARLCEEAKRLGYEKLYLFTEDQEALYTHLGWCAMSNENYYDMPVTVMYYQL